MDFGQAAQLIDDQLKGVEAEMSKNLLSEIAMIPTVSRHLIASGGKRFRPVLLLLSAHLCGYQGPRAIPLASTMEFIHTATLLHDDVVDGAFLRRGLASANSIWGEGASVLVGDFLFCKSFSLIVKDGNLHILDIVAEATTRMAEGEVMQLVKKGDPKITEEDYYFVVINKTAVLISAAARIGGILGGTSPEREEALAGFGLNLGIAFQLMDDMLDYVSQQGTLGKAIGKDLSEGKITLPLIQTLRLCPPAERERVSRIIQDGDRGEEDLACIWRTIQDYSGIEYTQGQAENFVKKAKTFLAPFPDCPAKEALLAVSDYTIHRKL